VNTYTQSMKSEDWISLAQNLSAGIVRTEAKNADLENRFPAASISALQDEQLFSYMVPKRFGGHFIDISTYWKIAANLGQECLSTALIWTMHNQQVAVLGEHSAEQHGDILTDIALSGSLVASVTSEYGKGGDLLKANTPIGMEGDLLNICRKAPIVSYGIQAKYFLMTMRAAQDRPANDVKLVIVKSGDGKTEATGEWNAMGMRGTQSVPMQFDVMIDRDRMIAAPFRTIATKTMIPVGHLGWAASWYGAANGVVIRFVKSIRDTKGGSAKKLNSDLFVSRLAELRMNLDLMRAMIEKVAATIDDFRRRDLQVSFYEDITFQILVNNLKVASSKLSFRIVQDLMELCGIAQGYFRESELRVERVFRDLRSATLMFHNDRLLHANGTLIFVEGTNMSEIFNKEIYTPVTPLAPQQQRL
jgi:acyl-CoA dehydrogenase